MRVLKHLTQGEVAEVAGMSRQAVTFIETGRRARGLTVDEAEKLCRALGVQLCDMLGDGPVVVAVDTVP